MMHTTLDRKICEHVEFHVFVSPHSSRQHGIHTSRVCRVYLSMRSPPHLFRDSEVSSETSEDEFLLRGLQCEITLDNTVTGPI